MQTRLFETAQYIIGIADDMSRPVVSVAHHLNEGIGVSKKHIEQSSFNWVLNYMPSSKRVTNNIDELEQWQNNIYHTSEALHLASQILNYGSLFMWFAIGIAGLWIVCDLRFGDAQIFTCIGLIVAIIVNGFTYLYSTELFTNYFLN